MRILLLTTVFPNPFEPNKGVFNLKLARALAQKHEVRVISPISWVTEWGARRPAPGSLGPERRVALEGIEVSHPRYYYPPKLFRNLYSVFYWQSVRKTARRVVGVFPPDVVLAYWAHPDGEVATRVAREAGATSAIIVGGSDVLLLTRSRRRAWCVSRALRAADAVVAVSQSLRRRVIELGVESGKAHVWHQGIDPALFAPGDRVEARRRLGVAATGPVLLWVGRMDPVKGLDVLLKACVLLRSRGSAFHLYLVGDGPLRKELEGSATGLGLSGSVTFAGPCRHEHLPDWYQAADLTLLPSRSEGLPNVLRESLACGTPFVASNVGGIAEIADATCDRLVPPDDPAALAQATHQMLVGRHRVKRNHRSLSWEESAEHLVEILKRSDGHRQDGAGLGREINSPHGRLMSCNQVPPCPTATEGASQ